MSRFDEIKCCCKDCKDRKYKCHSVCEKYKEYRKIVDKIREKQRQEQDAANFVFSTMRNKLKIYDKKVKNNICK